MPNCISLLIVKRWLLKSSWNMFPAILSIILIFSVVSLSKKLEDEKFEPMESRLVGMEGGLEMSEGCQVQIDEQLKEFRAYQVKMEEELMAIKHDLQEQINILKTPPYSFSCATQDSYEENARTITYDKIFYSSSNVEGAVLDRNTGMYTSWYPGSYTISWTLGSGDDQGDG